MPFSFKPDGVELIAAPAAAPIKRFQVMGLRCSGTNYVAELIHSNTSLRPTSYLGWKHGFPSAQFMPADLLPVIVFRDPFEWVRSLYRKPWHYSPEAARQPFSQFIRQPVDTVMDSDLWHDTIVNLELLPLATRVDSLFRRWIVRTIKLRLGLPVAELDMSPAALPKFARNRSLQLDRHPITGKPFANPLQLRNAKCRAFLGYRERDCPCVFVRYEFARDQPERFLALLRDAFDVALNPGFVPIGEWLGEMAGADARKPVRDFKPDDVSFIVDQLDAELEDFLGYGERLRRHAGVAQSGKPGRPVPMRSAS